MLFLRCRLEVKKKKKKKKTKTKIEMNYSMCRKRIFIFCCHCGVKVIESLYLSRQFVVRWIFHRSLPIY